MIDLNYLKGFYPAYLYENVNYKKLILKEYLQLLILDYLTDTPYIRKIAFIGGTNLRLIKGIDRFSEVLDFDCKKLTELEFEAMTDDIVQFLQRSGYHVETRDKQNPKLKASRRNLYFPEFLFNLGLSQYRNERFLIKVESQDQEIDYPVIMTQIKGCGFFFNFPTPSDQVLCAMKIAALINRQKGRDFYDTMFLMEQTQPDYHFLSQKTGITSDKELKAAFHEVLTKIDLKQKARDFEHLAFNKRNTQRILIFDQFVMGL